MSTDRYTHAELGRVAANVNEIIVANGWKFQESDLAYS